MTATVYLHPRAVELNLYAVCSTLKARGFDVPRQPGQRFLVAVPDAPPPVRPPPSSVASSPVVPFERRARPFNLWWPRT